MMLVCESIQENPVMLFDDICMRFSEIFFMSFKVQKLQFHMAYKNYCNSIGHVLLNNYFMQSAEGLTPRGL